MFIVLLLLPPHVDHSVHKQRKETFDLELSASMCGKYQSKVKVPWRWVTHTLAQRHLFDTCFHLGVSKGIFSVLLKFLQDIYTDYRPGLTPSTVVQNPVFKHLARHSTHGKSVQSCQDRKSVV